MVRFPVADQTGICHRTWSVRTWSVRTWHLSGHDPSGHVLWHLSGHDLSGHGICQDMYYGICQDMICQDMYCGICQDMYYGCPHNDYYFVYCCSGTFWELHAGFTWNRHWLLPTQFWWQAVIISTAIHIIAVWKGLVLCWCPPLDCQPLKHYIIKCGWCNAEVLE